MIFKKPNIVDLNDKQIQILETAEKLFAENGFDGTSVRNIAKAADINIAMISYYFGSKEKLLESLLLYRISDFRMQLESVFSKNNGFIDTLDEIVTLIVKRIHKSRLTHKIINFEFSNEARQIDFDSYIEQKKQNLYLIKAFVEKGQKAGVFVNHVNIELLTATILGTYFHFYNNKKYYQNLFNLKDDEAIELYVHNELTLHILNTIKALLTHEN
ncbi:TetR family transcriptional regulator [Confluentibacter sediminis]|uniref:TetR family transcriptional regulator n=1 Tax=Confluentibacter sediminis TaxID=2219045 RepID=UPI001F3D9474|nr:TetR family transcriptional regulator [Confluentibacter sediminis]